MSHCSDFKFGRMVCHSEFSKETELNKKKQKWQNELVCMCDKYICNISTFPICMHMCDKYIYIPSLYTYVCFVCDEYI